MCETLVLLLEDDDAYRYAIARQLAAHGLRVRECPDYVGVLEAIEGGEPIAFLLADIKFPDGKPHGIATALMARTRLPDLPVAFMTAWPEFMDGDLTRGIGEVFLKPLNPFAMAQHIRSLTRAPQAADGS